MGPTAVSINLIICTLSGTASSDKLFFYSIRYRYDMRVFSRYDTIRYDMRASKKTFFLRNFRRIFGEFSEFLANFWNFRRCCSCWRLWFMGFLNFWGIFRIFGEFLEFSAKKDKKIIGFENIEILDMGGSIRYTLRYTKKSDISAFDKFPIR